MCDCPEPPGARVVSSKEGTEFCLLIPPGPANPQAHVSLKDAAAFAPGVYSKQDDHCWMLSMPGPSP